MGFGHFVRDLSHSETVRKKVKAHEIGDKNPIKELRNVHEELNVVEKGAGCLLYAGYKLVPLRSARPELLKIAHTTHLGEEVIWSNINSFGTGHL